ncbi:MAG: hypothetical protein KatS3mg082_2928 [Nitrospiraceae bacterium]|nr:MAG: hypothetical protein KatS3mg081_2453 [Gemmatimonadales bacterium]GIW56524.1 MAG: hypothetical protein KatS3mg082_2928 [Nitrospiraceae bacterium]
MPISTPLDGTSLFELRFKRPFPTTEILCLQRPSIRILNPIRNP